MSRILFASADEAFEQRVRDVYGPSLNGDLRRVDPASITPETDLTQLAGAPGVGAQVVAVGGDVALDAALELAARFDVERPDLSVLLIASPTPDVLERSLRAGVRDVVAPDAADADVLAAFDRAADIARRRQDVAAPVAPETARGRVITVVSPKGGSGKTTTSTNLAIGLARHAPGEVVLVDLDLQFGDAGSALQLDPESTIGDLGSATNLDPAAVKVALTAHPSGLFVLCAPESPAEAESITPEQAGATLNILAEQFRYVVVDTDAGLSEHALTAIELSTDLICVCSMDVPSVRGLRKELLALDQLRLTGARRHFLLNRADTRVGLETEDIEATVQLKVDVAIPSSRAVPLSLNQGVPVIESEPRSPAARQFAALVARFVDEPAPTKGRGGLLRRGKAER